MSSRIVRRLASWVALVAILAVTFMPTLTQAFASNFTITEVCSADSTRQSNPSDPHGQHVLDHCPYCALHAGLGLPPEPSFAAAFVPVPFREMPETFLRAPHSGGVWATSQPRAPPFFA